MAAFANQRRMREAGALLAQIQEQENLARTKTSSQGEGKAPEGAAAPPRSLGEAPAQESQKPKSIFATYTEQGND